MVIIIMMRIITMITITTIQSMVKLSIIGVSSIVTRIRVSVRILCVMG